jgi:hypothetical protein
VLIAFAEQAAVALKQARLTAQAAEADRLAAGNSMRTALLAAVSHDLRTPLAGIKPHPPRCARPTSRSPTTTRYPSSATTSSTRVMVNRCVSAVKNQFSARPPTGWSCAWSGPRSGRCCRRSASPAWTAPYLNVLELYRSLDWQFGRAG